MGSVIDPAFSTNSILSERLRYLVEAGDGEAAPQLSADVEFEVFAMPGANRKAKAPVDVVVAVNEINDQHGTGPLVKRVFGDRENLFSIRSQNDWGDHDFGDFSVCIPQHDRPRPECFRRALTALGNRQVDQILCVPFHSDELITSIAIRDGYEADLCMWLMDDQNIVVDVVPDDLMFEFLEKSSLRLFTHGELRDAYERKYGLKSYVLPAIVPHRYVATDLVPPPEDMTKGALIGSFWDQNWFARTCDALAGSGQRIDWYGNDKSPWLRFPPEEMERAGISALGLYPEERLVRQLRKYPYVVVPVGTFDSKETNTGVARLSLPGRILFAVASAHTPMLLIGSGETCGARFVKNFDLGEVVPYSSAAVAGAIERLTEPGNQMRIRKNAAAIAERLSDKEIGVWLRESIRLGEPADRRFEDLFAYETEAALKPLEIEPYRRTR